MLYTNNEINKRKNIETKIKNVINVTLYITLILIMIYNISLIAQSIINSNKTPSFFGIKTYVIVSGSMEPNINVGDIVIVKEKNDFQIGDIVSYRKGQSVITHRISQIIEEEEKVYKTKGDSNNTEDSENILEQNIEGKVIAVIPKIGNLTFILKKKITIIIIFIILYVYISKSYRKSKKRNLRHEKRLKYKRKI